MVWTDSSANGAHKSAVPLFRQHTAFRSLLRFYFRTFFGTQILKSSSILMMGEEGSFETPSRDFTSQKTAVFKQQTVHNHFAGRSTRRLSNSNTNALHSDRPTDLPITIIVTSILIKFSRLYRVDTSKSFPIK